MNKLNKLPKNVSLVLSGGGVRGAMHLGVIKALEENNIKIDAISGTSMGAIIGVLYCQGISPDMILKILTNNSFIDLFKYNWDKGGFLSMKRIKSIFKKHIPHNDFDQLKIPFYCCATNLDSGEYEIFSTGDLHNSVIASASIPIVFKPIEINEQTYYDGGLLDNTPYQPLIDAGCDVIIVIDLFTFSPMRIKKITEDVKVFTCYPKKSLRGILDFNHKYIKRRFDLGYKDMNKLLEKIIDELK